MSYLDTATTQIIEWNNVHGLDVGIDAQRELCQAEWQEWHDSNHKDLLEIGDIAFTVIYLHYLIKQQGADYISGYNDLKTLVQERRGNKYIKATIQSNWTKYMPVRKYNLQDASHEAEEASKKYKASGRYTQIVPRLSECGKYYFLIGKTKTGIPKVIKPSCFVGKDKFL